MESFGSLVDRLTIETNRLQQVGSKIDPEAMASIQRQIEILKHEIDDYFFLASTGEMEFEEPKNKAYLNEASTSTQCKDMAEAISHLAKSNITLWNLEDERRDKSLPDMQRLKAADKVSVVNKERNFYIDEVNRLFREKFSDPVKV